MPDSGVTIAIQLLARFLGWGATAGAVLGGIAGLIIGAFTHLPTVPFAIVEAGLLGATGGAVLGLLALLVSRPPGGHGPRVRAAQAWRRFR